MRLSSLLALIFIFFVFMFVTGFGNLFSVVR